VRKKEGKKKKRQSAVEGGNVGSALTASGKAVADISRMESAAAPPRIFFLFVFHSSLSVPDL
jgi:hypothetical protein